MSKKRGLGRSLDALLIGSRSIEEAVPSKDQLAQLPIAQIQRGKYQPRREMDTEALEELASSIRAQGIIQPIVVRPIAGNRYEIVAGERRWRASQLAGLSEIPALIKDIPDEAAIAIALIENIQRESLNPIEEGLALQRLLDEFGMTHQQVADSVGKSRASVTNMLRLLTLVADVKKMLENRQLEMGHARALLTLPEDLQIDVAKTILAQGLSVRDTEALVKRVQSPRLTTSSKPVDPDLNRLQQTFSKQIKLPVTIRCNAKGQGRLIIQYKKLAELDRLLAFFQDVEVDT
jgi:ParB family chromosome partitioning protein